MTTNLTTDMTTPPMCRMTNSEINEKIKEGICPEPGCGGTLQNGGNCHTCLKCGWSRC